MDMQRRGPADKNTAQCLQCSSVGMSVKTGHKPSVKIQGGVVEGHICMQIQGTTPYYIQE